MKRRIAILGGGIAGLAAANRIRELALTRAEPIELHLFERSVRAGGCINTVMHDGFAAELGPDALVAKPALSALLERLHIDDAIEETDPANRRACVERNGRLVPLPADFRLFAPSSAAALARSGLLSARGIMRAAAEPFVPTKHDECDESIASFVTRRFGRELFERIAQPLTSGIFSGNPEHVSIEATMPFMPALERRYGSVMRGLATARGATAPPKAPRMISLHGGLQRLVDRLAYELAPFLHLNCDVVALEHNAGKWNVRLDNGDEYFADAIVCALPAHAAAWLLSSLDEGVALQLHSILYHDVATIALGYDALDVPELPPATGFVVPESSGRSVMSVTFASQKFAHRAPRDAVLLRAVVGGAFQPELLDLDDVRLLARVITDLRELLGIRSAPRYVHIRRWKHTMPEYSVGHVERVAAIERIVRTLPALALAGSAYHGAGIADCIASGEAAAESVFAGSCRHTGTSEEWTLHVNRSYSSVTATR